MKITIYTIKDCAFSKQEKEYLTANKLMFEEKDLETNKDFLTEMLAISNNFAGTPVTRIEKDDGTIAVLKGFTKEEFDTTFGLAPMPAAPAEVGAPTEPAAPIEAPASPAVDVPPVAEAPTEAVSPEVPPATTVPNETPLKTPIGDQDLSKEVAGPLQSVMDSLKSKSAEPTPTPTQPTETPTAVPPVVDPSAPAIPDFPMK